MAFGLGVVIQGLGFAVRGAPCLQGEDFATAAGAVALALGAGVVMSALAIDLTDAAVASAVLAAGSTSSFLFKRILLITYLAYRLCLRLALQRIVLVGFRP